MEAKMFGKKYQRDKRKKLLYEVLKAGGAITIVFVAPGAAPFILKPFMEQNGISNSDLRRSIKTMSDDGLISSKENAKGELTIKLRKEGKLKALKYQIDEMTLKTPKKWDKKWRVVMFDIPESKRAARAILKNKLDELGFKQIQKSIYVHPFPCEDELEFITTVYGVRQYTQVLVADKVQDATRLKRHFDL